MKRFNLAFYSNIF